MTLFLDRALSTLGIRVEPHVSEPLVPEVQAVRRVGQPEHPGFDIKLHVREKLGDTPSTPVIIQLRWKSCQAAAVPDDGGSTASAVFSDGTSLYTTATKSSEVKERVTLDVDAIAYSKIAGCDTMMEPSEPFDFQVIWKSEHCCEILNRITPGIYYTDSSERNSGRWYLNDKKDPNFELPPIPRMFEEILTLDQSSNHGTLLFTQSFDLGTFRIVDLVVKRTDQSSSKHRFVCRKEASTITGYEPSHTSVPPNSQTENSNSTENPSASFTAYQPSF